MIFTLVAPPASVVCRRSIDDVLREGLGRCESDDAWLQGVVRDLAHVGLFDAWQTDGRTLVRAVELVGALAESEGGLATAVAGQLAAYRTADRVNWLGGSRGAASLTHIPHRTPPALTLVTGRLQRAGATDVIRGRAILPALEDSTRLVGVASTKTMARGVAFVATQADAGLTTRRALETVGLRSLRMVDVEYGVSSRDGCWHRCEARHETVTLAAAAEADLRVLATAVILGIASAILKYVLQYARQRETFGRPLWRHQAVSLRLAELATRLAAAELLLLDVSRRVSNSRQLRAARACWCHASELALDVGVQGVQLLGGHGYLRRHPIEKWLRDVQTLRLLYA
jgi:alkylation response protein AidB-like acyl-CoA dehydrogenase